MSTQPCHEPQCKDTPGAVELVIEPRARDLGGFEVRRVLPAAARRLVGPFIFFDEFGPVQFAPGTGLDVRPHPHIGLATVTYLFEGEILHRDSLGHVQPIRPGALNWMTAGSGIVHSERSPPGERATGPRLHGIQSWVALPLEHEETEPAFSHHPAESLPVIEESGVRMRLIAGSAFGERAPVEVASELCYLEAELAAGAVLALSPEHEERAVYVVAGEVSIDGAPAASHCMYVLAPGEVVAIEATGPSRLMLLGGAPLEGKRHIWWNFVSSSRERIEDARRNWQAGRFAKVPGETEFIPLPDF